MPGGRPRKYNWDQVVEALRLTRGNLSAAGRLLGCTQRTVRRYVQRHQGKRNPRR